MLSFPVPVPKNGDDFDATPVGQNLTYLLNVLQAYDLSNVLAGSALDTLFAPSNSPLQRFIDGFQSFVVSGGLPSGFSTLSYTVPAIIGATFQSNGVRVASITGQSFTAAINSDTYVSCRSTGVINTPQAVANNATPPALPTADSQWLCKVISNGTTITSILDLRQLTPLGAAGYVQITGNVTTASTTTVQATGLTLPVYISAARRMKVSFFTSLLYNQAASRYSTVELWDGPVVSGTKLQQGDSFTVTANTGTPGKMEWSGPLTTGWHTFNVGFRSDGAGGGTAGIQAGAGLPASLLVETD
jgi:hypothetical protein